MQPQISVIIPAFNAENFIADAINSVLAQKYSQETEILVVDDGSTDNTIDVVSKMSTKYQQIVILLNEQKKGPSGARNTGLIKAKGDYIAFLDADDLWQKNHLEEGVDFLEKHNQIDVVFYNFEIRESESMRKIGDWFSERSFTKTLKAEEIDNGYFLICDNMYYALLEESFMHLQSMIIRSSSIGGLYFNENIKRSEDRDFSIRLYQDLKVQFAYKNLITGIYYRRSNSLTSNSIDNSLSTLLDQIYIFTEYLSHKSNDSILVLRLKRMLFERHIELSYSYRQIYNYRLAIKSILKSLDYGISISQLKELTKIAASSVYYIVFHRPR